MDYKELIEELRMVASWDGVCYDCIQCAKSATAIETLLGERDAAVERMHWKCVECKYGTKYPWNPPCNRCIFSGNDNCSKDYWEWRGLKKGDAQ